MKGYKVELREELASPRFGSMQLATAWLILFCAATLGACEFQRAVTTAPDNSTATLESAEPTQTVRPTLAATYTPDTTKEVEASPTAPIAPPLIGRIAFVRTGDGTDDIYLVNVDGSELVALTDEGWFNQSPAWSPNGESIAFASDQSGSRGMFDLYVLEVGSTRVSQFTRDAATWEDQPSWSPDGRRIAFTVHSFEEDLNSDIFLVDADGRHQTNLTNSDSHEEFPAWSPSGKQIAFLSKDDSSQEDFELSLMNVDGTGRTILSDLTANGPVTWSPEGDWIAFVSSSGAPNVIQLIRADGSERRTLLLDGLSYAAYPTWSPDGNWIAFSSTAEGTSGIFAATIDGSALVRVTSNPEPAMDLEPAWVSP